MEEKRLFLVLPYLEVLWLETMIKSQQAFKGVFKLLQTTNCFLMSNQAFQLFPILRPYTQRSYIWKCL